MPYYSLIRGVLDYFFPFVCSYSRYNGLQGLLDFGVETITLKHTSKHPQLKCWLTS